jgi:hypothetical protein
MLMGGVGVIIRHRVHCGVAMVLLLLVAVLILKDGGK